MSLASRHKKQQSTAEEGSMQRDFLRDTIVQGLLKAEGTAGIQRKMPPYSRPHDIHKKIAVPSDQYEDCSALKITRAIAKPKSGSTPDYINSVFC